MIKFTPEEYEEIARLWHMPAAKVEELFDMITPEALQPILKQMQAQEEVTK